MCRLMFKNFQVFNFFFPFMYVGYDLKCNNNLIAYSFKKSFEFTMFAYSHLTP